MNPITTNLYQFTSYIPPMDFTIHQYLLATTPSILFSTGTAQKAEEILPEIKEILKGNSLDYIFISHIESDECGGLGIILREYPQVKVICSTLGARELFGYGYKCDVIVGNPEQELVDGELDLQFFDYPSEVHLQNGLICFEKNTNMLYSADLMLRYGNGGNQVLPLVWSEEVEKISNEQIPNEQKLEKMKNDLLTISPDFIAVGHGFCLDRQVSLVEQI